MVQDTTQIGRPKVELTQEGFDELQAELTQLKSVKLPQVIDRVAAAREHGDLSENSEYHSAKEEQQLIETRIDEVESILNNAVVVQATKSRTVVGVGTVVVIARKGQKKQQTFTVVGEFEAEPGEGKVSINAPLGKALNGKRKGDTVMVQAPAGEVEYTIVELQ